MAFADRAVPVIGRRGVDSLPPEEQESLLAKLGRQSGQALSDVLWHIDTPAALIRSGIDFLQDGQWNNPLDAEKRVTGEQILHNAGWQEDTTPRWLAGAALEVATDPLSWATGPATSLTKAGILGKKAGVLDNVAAVASRKLQNKTLADATQAAAGTLDPAVGLTQKAAEALTPTLPGRAQRTLSGLDTNIRDFVEHEARPLVGRRTAMQDTTLGDLMANADTQTRANLDANLKEMKLNWNDVKDQPVGKAFGFAGAGESTAFNPLTDAVGRGIAAAHDRVGEVLRWGKIPGTNLSPGVGAHALFSKMVGGQTDSLSQAAAVRINKAAEEGRGQGGRETAEIANDLRQVQIRPDVAQRTGIHNILSPEANDALDRYREKVAATPNDIDFVENTPGALAFWEKWDTKASELLTDSANAGLRSHALSHDYGLPYRPYKLENVLDAGTAKGSKKKQGALFDTMTGDMIKRVKSLQLPGGLDHVRWLSSNPEYVGLGAKFDEDTIAKKLYDEINGAVVQGPQLPGMGPLPKQVGEYYKQRAGSMIENGPVDLRPRPVNVQGPSLQDGRFYGGAPEYTMGKARSLANWLNKREVVKDAAGNIQPAFGMHPAEAIASYIPGRRGAEAIAKEVTSTIASRLVPIKKSQVPGGGHISARAALTRAGLKSPRIPKLDANGNQVFNAKTGKPSFTQARGGANANLRTLIAEKINATGGSVTADDIDLSKYSIPEDVLNHLTRMADHYASPAAVTKLGDAIDQYTRVFKAGVLSWPSRFSRDISSGFVSNSIEAGSPARAMAGSMAASHILKGNYQKAIPFLREIPAYKGIVSDEDVIKQYLLDAADSQILGGGAIIDRHNGDRAAEAVTKILPGWKPQSVLGSLPNDPNRSWGGALRDAVNPFGIRGVLGNKETTNPIFQWGEKMGDFTDSLNRLGGYNALLRYGGVAPKEAARRMMAAHVRYDNLSSFEKNLRKLIPFYSYNSRIGKYAVEKMMERPGGGLSQVYRMVDRAQQSDDDTYIPETYRLQSGFALPKELGSLAEPSKGVRRFVKNIDVPGLSTLNLISSSKTGGKLDLNSSMVTTLQNLAEQLHPLPRTAIEAITQRDMHTKRKLGEAPSEIETIVGALTGDEDFRLPTMVQSAADVIMPGAGRVLNASRQMADSRVENVTDRAAQMLFNQVAPFRFGLVDQKRQRQDAIRQLDEELSRAPGAKGMEITSIPEDKVAELTPQLQQYYRLRQQLQKENQKAARERKKAQQRATRFGLQ